MELIHGCGLEDEIGIVTKAFNQMLVSIRQYMESLRAEHGDPAVH